MNPPPRRGRPAPALALIAGLLLVPACGPGDGRPPLHPATGKVAYQGAPVPGAFVAFHKAPPDEKIPSPTAVTRDDGTFTLTTFQDDDGAPEGDYVVTISTTPARGERGLSLDNADSPRDVLKGRFADPKTSGLKAAIKPGPNAIGPFDLK